MIDGQAWTAQRRLTREQVALVVAGAGLGDPASVRIVHSGFRATARFASPDGERAVQLTALRSAAELESATDYQKHVAQAGAPVARPRPWPDGATVREVSIAGQPFRATLSDWAPGEPVGRDCRDPAVHRAWGVAIGALHAATGDYRLPADPPPLTRDREWQETRSRLATAPPEVAREVARVEVWLADRAADGLRVGVVHGDMNAGNAIWDGERITLIDFEEPMLDWWAADVARPLRELDTLRASEQRALMDPLIEGYAEVRSLSTEEVAALPWLVRAKNLSIYGWWLAEAPGDAEPEELRSLRARIVRGATAADER